MFHVAMFLAQFIPLSPVPCQALTYHEAPTYEARSEAWYVRSSNTELDGYWSGSQACVDRRVTEDMLPCGDLMTNRALAETSADVLDVCDPDNQPRIVDHVCFFVDQVDNGVASLMRNDGSTFLVKASAKHIEGKYVCVNVP